VVTPRKVLVAAFALLVYVAMWAGFLQGWSWLDTVDDRLLSAFHDFGVDRQIWLKAWDWFCDVFSPITMRILSVFLIAWLLRRRRHREALFLLLSVEVSGIITGLAKGLADRPRPATAMAAAPGTSFPSGHALGVMVCVLALLTVLLPMVAARWRTALMVFGAVIVVLIGVGRVVLNVHHPSDVVAGWALGYLYYLLCLPVLTARAGTLPHPQGE
jgi:membrane-associated phospholipid phosphatase